MHRLFVVASIAVLLATVAPTPAAPTTVLVTVDTTHRIQTFRPLRTIGTSVDADPKAKIPLLYSPSRTRLMLGTGLGTLTYRLYTELSIQDWHWNPNGRYSDAARQQGYWTSSAAIGTAPITYSYGYLLPHRGSSRDQGDDDNYSRIDDGDSSTYWKSDPYLTHLYTGEPEAANPQWAIVQFLEPHAIDAIRVAWANPYATHYLVQYWTSNADPVLHEDAGDWRTFARGTVTDAKGGAPTIRLTARPVTTYAVRILMTQSSDTCDTHGAADRRNCVGYAIQDIGLGRLERSGFHDDIVRSTSGSCGGELVCSRNPKRQTLIWTSSDDPWHSERNAPDRNGAQPGLDLIARSALTRGLPTIYPVPVFYSTPQNAANEVRYLEARHYPIDYIEMGEEVDGQYALPEDYAALYIQFADAIHNVDRNVKLGGPVFQGVNQDVAAWKDASGDTSWLRRFVKYLSARGHLRDLAFMSYEHYPYHHCDSGAQLQADLLDEPSFVRRMARQWRADGVPANVPLLETENNFSPDGTSAPQHAYGALWTADFIGSSLASNISYMTYYKAEAYPLGFRKQCNDWGEYGPYITDKHYTILAKGAGYYAVRLLTTQWSLPGDRPHGVYAVASNLGDHNALVTAYALRRPDGQWSVLLVNKDHVTRHVTIAFRDRGGATHFSGTVHVATFGSDQYAWDGKPTDVPKPDLGIKEFNASAAASYAIAPRSITVIRGDIRT